MFNRLKEFFAFTKNEQKVFLFLSIVFLSGVAIKIYKTYVVSPKVPEFDYARSDSIFLERSKLLISGDSAGTGISQKVFRKINVNRATKTELMTLPGVGETTAERILLYRDESGSFKSIHDLKKVKGIGEKKFEKLKPYIEVQ